MGIDMYVFGDGGKKHWRGVLVDLPDQELVRAYRLRVLDSDVGDAVRASGIVKTAMDTVWRRFPQDVLAMAEELTRRRASLRVVPWCPSVHLAHLVCMPFADWEFSDDASG